MTNPDNAVGTNAAYSGRTSVNAFNDDLAVYSRGIMSGWACAPDSGMTVALGGDGSTRDVAVAEDNAGNKTTINNISGAPVSVTIEAAPANNSRIDAIVAYVDNPPQGSATIADNYEACGLISVSGTASSSPVEPSDGAIRSAITADGASGATAYYVVLATVTVASGTTDITADVITPGVNAMIQARNILPSNPSQVNIYGERATNSTTYQDLAGTYTVPADGMYNVSTAITTANASSTKFTLRAAIMKNNTQVSPAGLETMSVISYSNNNFATLTTSASFFAKSGDVIKLRTAMVNWTGKSIHNTMIQRIY